MATHGLTPGFGDSFFRRAAEGVAFIGVWVLLGTWMRLTANTYLLLGIPLTLFFQLVVRRRPVNSLWVRDAPTPENDAFSWTLALLLAIFPIRVIIAAVVARDLIVAGWGASAVLGAVAAAYALRQFHRETLRHLIYCTVFAGFVGLGILTIACISPRGNATASELFRLKVLAKSLFCYFPACFVLEEVAFRGALDAHLYHPGQPYPLASALLTSALWGLWHLPIAANGNLLLSVISLILFHCAIGLPLSLFWRKSGNLAVPAFGHAMIDAARNAVLF